MQDYGGHQGREVSRAWIYKVRSTPRLTLTVGPSLQKEFLPTTVSQKPAISANKSIPKQEGQSVNGSMHNKGAWSMRGRRREGFKGQSRRQIGYIGFNKRARSCLAAAAVILLGKLISHAHHSFVPLYIYELRSSGTSLHFSEVS